MHEHELSIDQALVERLVAAQFPQWANLPVRHASSAGTDNAMFRLGDTMVVRLPRIDWAAGSVDHEQAWLPVIGPLLPVETPTVLGMGEPAHGYPWRWSVYTWLDGANPTAKTSPSRSCAISPTASMPSMPSTYPVARSISAASILRRGTR